MLRKLSIGIDGLWHRRTFNQEGPCRPQCECETNDRSPKANGIHLVFLGSLITGRTVIGDQLIPYLIDWPDRTLADTPHCETDLRFVTANVADCRNAFLTRSTHIFLFIHCLCVDGRSSSSGYYIDAVISFFCIPPIHSMSEKNTRGFPNGRA
jgi:hypothetical protein